MIELDFLKKKHGIPAHDSVEENGFRQIVRTWVFQNTAGGGPMRVVEYDEFLTTGLTTLKKLHHIYLKLPTGGYMSLTWDKFHDRICLPYGQSMKLDEFNSMFGPWTLETVMLPVAVWCDPRDR